MTRGVRRTAVFLTAATAIFSAGGLAVLDVGRPVAYTDGSRVVFVDRLVDASMLEWARPTPIAELPGPIEGRVASLPDGRVVYGRVVGEGDVDLVVFDPARPERGAAPLTACNSPAREFSPALGPDGRLYFASDRPGGRGGFDLWSAPFENGTAGSPTPLDAPVNSAHDEADPSPDPFGGVVFVRRDPGLREGRNGALLRVDAENEVAAVLTSDDGLEDAIDRDPCFSNDGVALWFVRERPGFPPEVRRTWRHGGSFVASRDVVGLASAERLRSPTPIGAGFELRLATAGETPLLYRATAVELYPYPEGAAALRRALLTALIASLVLLALLLLGKKWRALDFVTWCLLVSLLLHVLVLWLLRDLLLERRIDAAEGEDRFEVVLSAAPDSGGVAAPSEARGAFAAAQAAALVFGGHDVAAPAASAPNAAVARAERDAVVDVGAPAPLAAPAPSDAVAAPRPEVADAATSGDSAPLRNGVDAVSERSPPAALEALRPAPPTAGATSSSGPASSARSTESIVVSAPGTLFETPARAEHHAARRTSDDASKDDLAATPAPRRGSVGAPEVSLNDPSRRAAKTPNTDAGESPVAARTEEAKGRATPRPSGVDALDGPDRSVGGPRVRRTAETAEGATEIEVAAPGSTFAKAARAAGADTGPIAAPPAPVDRFAGRYGPAKTVALDRFGGGMETERAVASGLRYLASIQNPDGSWGGKRPEPRKYGNVDVGKSALCLLAFLGAGHVPGSDAEHANVALRAAAFLVGEQDRDTGHVGVSCAYSHGIATYALAEAYAMTKAPSLKPPLEAATRWIERNQNRGRDRRSRGGWGYYSPFIAPEDGFARTSITSWQVMALESARIGGIAVDPSTLTAAREFLLQNFDQRTGGFLYNREPGRLASGWRTLPASTPAAVFSLRILGLDAADERLSSALKYTLARAPGAYGRADRDAFVLEAEGNTYFWYYGTLACFLAGGADWERWNARLKATLLPAQASDGSFPPIDSYADYAGDTRADRAYTTALCVLSLEVYYRYFTPLLVGR